MVCRIVKQTGTSCLQQNVSRAGSPWRRATGGSRRSTIITTASASTARYAKRTSKDRVSSPREADLFARVTPANTPQIIYNSDTVYSTTTFRPVSPSPLMLTPKDTPSPQRTRKLETPLHFDGGLFSDIRSTDGKLLSKVTVDRIHSSTRHDVTDSPSVYEHVGSYGTKDYVDDIIKTETITNEDVIKVKFTPVPPELDTPRLLTPSQFQVNRVTTPIEYIKDNYEDLQSYKIVSSLCKEQHLETDNTSNCNKEKSTERNLIVEEPFERTHSPLANFLVSEQLTKIDSYLQDSLDACSIHEKMRESIVRDQTNTCFQQAVAETMVESKDTVTNRLYDEKKYYFETSASKNSSSYQETEKISICKKELTPQREKEVKEETQKTKSELTHYENGNKIYMNNTHKNNRGVFSTIYNMPIHYHAAILCFVLIVYNLVYQYIKQNCHGNKK